ncbi:hypothetical protein [Pseudoalteromonas maricaloris]|uniref:hypothetical protein n=1 Tax=Pseudoalteromonas maricaloris TaxID=184924 RepID=UPI00057E0A86|nr:hypothetical protein [Pseudoalteromonas flavipulchra]KID34833.1 hypothetical protein QT15_17220 [Pseudoalteromonas flavipulchra NCIMB 2033 = ATCC BAA-314]MBD0784055.1 hypothetical protein [Pseudoalteromonas flavipulchra]MBE0372882.1 hypothetical protein [Pseudoalteromonas flavipulchra NCIMB 2033 = ATCC BAA-314]
MQCVTITESGQLIATTQPACEYVLLTQAELTHLQFDGLVNTLNELFAFDLATFGLINAAALTAFFTAHGIGRIVRTMGKA